MHDLCLSARNEALQCSSHRWKKTSLDVSVGGGVKDEYNFSSLTSSQKTSKPSDKLNSMPMERRRTTQKERKRVCLSPVDPTTLPREISITNSAPSPRKEPSYSSHTSSLLSESSASAAEIFYSCLNGTLLESSNRDDTDFTEDGGDSINFITPFSFECDDALLLGGDYDDDDGSFACLQVDGYESYSSMMNEGWLPKHIMDAEGKFLKTPLHDTMEDSNNDSSEVAEDYPTPNVAPPRTFRGFNSLARCRLSVAQPAGKPKRSVSFGTVHVRYYERIISVNPACTCGVPIGIGWRYKRGTAVSVDEFELQRGVPRTSSELLLPRNLRATLMIQRGYDQKDLTKATRMLIKFKNQRKQTITSLLGANVEEAIERTTRQVIKLLSPRARTGRAKADDFSQYLPY